MTKRIGCAARQYSDQMICDKCGVVWDVSDTDPPECQPKKPKNARSTKDRVKEIRTKYFGEK